jgi:ribonuclease P/MRP protein subunit POP5
MVRFKVLPSFLFLAANRTTCSSLSCQNRWLLIEFIPATSTPGQAVAISGKDVFHALKQSVLLHFGDVGWGEVGASLAGEM